ncbi:MAG: nucleoside deaminase [Bacteroidales bacterium]|nr:nucleoside deaminase [Bacteroidales bacterium]MBN2821471.1 nucleoside deaminase [Bacteroidales bacterium]
MEAEIFSHEYFMKEALKEAQKAFDKNEVPVGVVVVAKNTIIARAHNLTETLNDVTAHAEMQAITAATNYLGAKYLDTCTIYVTLEPCVMCAGALFWSQISEIVFGAIDNKRGYSLINQPLLHPKTSVLSGIMEQQCSKLMTDFFKKKR